MTPRMDDEPQRAARAKTAHWRMAVDKERRSVRRMRKGKRMVLDDKAGRMIGRRGNVRSSESTSKRTREACKAVDGDNWGGQRSYAEGTIARRTLPESRWARPRKKRFPKQ